MKQGQNCKKIKLINRSLGQRGQAAVEYVLLLVVIVSMILAAKGLFSGVNNFINGYIGQYFTCLMDHGELPQLGVVVSDLKKHLDQPNCKATFSIANGATLTGSGGSSGSSGAGSRTSGKSSSKNDSSPTSKNSSPTSKNKRSGGGGDDSSSGGGGGSGSGSAYAKGRIQRSNSGNGTADGSSYAAASKTKVIEENQVAGSAYGRKGDSRGTEYRYNKYKAITDGQMFDEIQKNSGRDQRRIGPRTVSQLAVEEGFRPGPRKNAFIPPERKPALEGDDAEPDFGFGQMMKWLMIAGMVVAIIVFFGGQILNYSNSE